MLPKCRRLVLGFTRVDCSKKEGLGSVMSELTLAEYEREKDAEMSRIWDSFLPFYSQYYWHKNWNDEWTMAYYHGPRIKWMKLIKEKKNERRARRK